MNTARFCLALLLLCAGLTPALHAGQPGPAAQSMVPIRNWQPVNDSSGCQWYLQPDACLNYGMNGYMERVMYLQMGNGNVNWTARMQSADGSRKQFTGQAGGLTVQRNVVLLLQQGAAQFVDTFTNNSNAPQTCAPMQIFNVNQVQQINTDAGRSASGPLGKKDCGLVLIRSQGFNQPETLVVVGGAGNSNKPVVNFQQNSQLSLQWSFTIKPGATVSVLTIIAVRSGAGSMPAGKLSKECKDLVSRKSLANLPKEVVSTLLNVGGGSLFGDSAGMALLEELGLDRSDADQIALGSGTTLKGTASCAELSIVTDFGTATIPVENLAALTGPVFTGGPTCAYLRDGQAVAGKAAARELSFISRTGITLPLKPEALDRIVFHEKADDGKPSAKTSFYLQMFDGSRLALSSPPQTPLQLLSTWGPRTIPFGEIQRLEALGDEMLGYRIATRDGSEYFCYLSPAELTVETTLFGTQKILPARIRALTAVQEERAGEDSAAKKDDAPQVPHVRLIGDSILCGTIDLPALRLQSGITTIPVPPNQIRLLTNDNAEDDSPDAPAPVFAGELWGSGAVSGELLDFVLPIRTPNGLLRVPARDIVEIAVPTPVVPDSVRQRIAELIRNLGNDQWSARDKASTELQELGVMARQQLQEQLGQTADEEVRWRIQKLLDAIGE